MNGGILYEKPLESPEDFAERLLKRESPRVFYPEALFAGMGGVQIKLPSEIRRNGAWEELSHEEIAAWIRSAGAYTGDAEAQPENVVGKILQKLGARA